MFRSEGLQELQRIEDLAWRKNAASLNLAIKDALGGFDDKRRRESIDVASPRYYTSCSRPIAGDHIQQERLRRTPRLVGGRRRRRSGIAKIAQRREVEIGAKVGHPQMTGDQDRFGKREFSD